jgi:hypothetical protein
MCKSEGSFDLKFKTEKSYSLFGRKYAECYANAGARGQFSRPNAKGENTYEVRFKAECGCDTIIKNFNFGYEKTFGDKMLTARALKPLAFAGHADSVSAALENTTDVTPDYTITLMSCGVPRGDSLFAANAGPLYAAGVNSPPSQLSATAVDSQLGFAATDVPADMVNAIAYTTLYTQAAARQVLKDRGVDITKTDYMTSRDWYDLQVTEMTDLGFTAKVATTGGIQQNTYSGDINIGAIINTLLSAYLGAAEVSEFKALADMLSKDPDDTGAKDFLTFWWSYASSETKRTNLAFSPVTVDQGEASITAVFFMLDVAFQDWRSMFVSYHHESVNIWSSAIKLNLNMDVYGGVKDDIESAIRAQIKKHIKHTTLNFGS